MTVYYVNSRRKPTFLFFIAVYVVSGIGARVGPRKMEVQVSFIPERFLAVRARVRFSRVWKFKRMSRCFFQQKFIFLNSSFSLLIFSNSFSSKFFFKLIFYNSVSSKKFTFSANCSRNAAKTGPTSYNVLTAKCTNTQIILFLRDRSL